MRSAVVVVSALLMVVAAEIATRWIDGYQLFPPLLLRISPPPTIDENLVTDYVNRLTVPADVDRRWFADDPDESSGGSTSPDPELVAYAAQSHGYGPAATVEWNLEYLRESACETGPRHDQAVGGIFPAGTVFVFEPFNHSPYPRFRFLRNAHYPSGLVTNSYGWRGKDVPFHKPDDTIRIAFVGASTTVAPHTYRYSYPDHVRRWLDDWRRARRLPIHFDVINAGREAIDSSSIAAVVRDELAPLQPDIVVYYEGANQFGPADYVIWPGGTPPRKPARIHEWPFESRSAIVRRIRLIRDPFLVRQDEPRKPHLGVAWPAGVDENNPRLDDRRLSLDLPTIIRDLDTIRGAVASYGGRLAVSSFVWCVRDGLQLDPVRDAGVYSYLNDMFWPFSYAYLRRMADFQNRTLEVYARLRGAEFFDVAGKYPIDPRLFFDGVHMTARGTKLMAWITFAALESTLTRLISDGRLPRRSTQTVLSHPAFAGPTRQRLSVAAIRGGCIS